MAKRQPIEMGGLVFRTKTALTAYVRGILYGNAPEEPIGGESASFLLALLGRHPQATQKIGAGVERFFVRVNTQFGDNKGFWLRRVDGTETDWSFLECITPTDHRKKFLNACRGAVAHQVIAFKAMQVGQSDEIMACPITGELFAPADGHVDHAEPSTFEAIVDAFVGENQIDITNVVIDFCKDGQLGDLFVDQDLARRWIAFHEARANLRLISPHANLSNLRRRRQRDDDPEVSDQ